MLYRYEYEWTGFLSAVFAAWKDSEAVFTHMTAEDEPYMLETVTIAANDAHASRLWNGMRRLDRDLPDTIFSAWSSETPGIESDILNTLRLGFSHKKDPMPLLMEPCVFSVNKAARRFGGERHLHLGIIRFLHADGIYIADIRPECNILPSIGQHFHERFNTHRLIIRDVTRHTALISSPEGWHVTSLPPGKLPPLPKDGEFEHMWRKYFEVIANPARLNRKLQMKFVPLKNRSEITEFKI